jgi:hypothetical protein
MTALNAFATGVDNRMNPIVVKELRQAVGGRFIAGVLGLFLVVQLLVFGGMAMTATHLERDMQAGRDAFSVLHGIVLTTALLFIPAYTALRMMAERSDANVDLLFITTIKPRTIILGKLLSALVLVGLIYSASLPFLSLTFLLRGIDLPTVALAMGIDALIITGVLALAIFIACMPVSRVMRVVLGLGLLWVVVMAISLGVSLTSELIMSGAGSAMGTSDFWLGVAVVVTIFVIAAGLLLTTSTAMLSPPSSNRALGPRLLITVGWAGTLGGALVYLNYYPSTDEPLIAWAWVWQMLLFLVMLVKISERSDWSPRILANVPTNPLRRALAFVFTSGAAGGTLWAMALMGGTLLVTWWGSERSPNDREWQWTHSLLGVFTLYAVAYGLTSLTLQRTLLRGLLARHNTHALALLLLAAATFIPLFIVIFIDGDIGRRPAENPLFIGCPFWMFDMTHDARLVPRLTFAGVWCAAMLAMHLPWVAMRFIAFRRPAIAATAATPPAEVSPEATPASG